MIGKKRSIWTKQNLISSLGQNAPQRKLSNKEYTGGGVHNIRQNLKILSQLDIQKHREVHGMLVTWDEREKISVRPHHLFGEIEKSSR